MDFEDLTPAHEESRNRRSSRRRDRSSLYSEPKDTWDKIDIIGKGIVLPLAIAALSIVVNISLSQINGRLKTSENDIHLMTTFKDIYYGEKSKRLAEYFTRQMSDSKSRHQLETFMVWDALEGHLAHSESKGFIFDSEEPDWHLLGDAVTDRLRDANNESNARDFLEWWRYRVKDTAYTRWPKSQVELVKLFRWVETVYIEAEHLPQTGLPLPKQALLVPEESPPK
jgi:hypothetical protein